MSANKTNRQSRRLILILDFAAVSIIIIHMQQSLKSSAWIIVPDRTKKKDIFTAINTKIQNHRACNHGSRGQLQFPFDCNIIIFGITIVSTLVDGVFYPLENLQEHHNLHTSYIVFKSNRLKLRMLRF